MLDYSTSTPAILLNAVAVIRTAIAPAPACSTKPLLAGRHIDHRNIPPRHSRQRGFRFFFYRAVAELKFYTTCHHAVATTISRQFDHQYSSGPLGRAHASWHQGSAEWGITMGRWNNPTMLVRVVLELHLPRLCAPTCWVVVWILRICYRSW